jgi:hypothetical protein
VLRAFLQTPASGTRRVWSANDSYLSGLESTEKGGVSYYLGMAFASHLAGDLLPAPWVVHRSTYASDLNVLFGPPPGKKRARQPDFLALADAHTIYVLEAKGRCLDTPGIRDAALNAAVEQKSGPIVAGSVTPTARVASGLFVSPSDGVLSVEWRDPALDTGDDRVRGDFLGPFMRSHYSRIYDLLGPEQARRPFQGLDFVDLYVSEMDAHVGLDARVMEALRQHSNVELAEVAFQLESARADNRWAIGGDGSMVELGPSWQSTDDDGGVEQLLRRNPGDV